jgi:8-oxo-dGTP pyrophosphatase MutT (NUDIX family)
MKGRKPRQAAAIEAFEEAGVVGQIHGKALGTFSYDKVKSRGVLPCSVKVYPLRVRELKDKWPEGSERERRWFSPEDAAAAGREPELAEILKSFGTGAFG